jgi:hypothetical protein
MLTPQVVRVLQSDRLTPAGQVERQVRVTYMVSSFGPFEAVFPEAGFNADAVKKVMDARAAELAKLPGPFPV